jgi:hypothetical protein
MLRSLTLMLAKTNPYSDEDGAPERVYRGAGGNEVGKDYMKYVLE